MELPEGAELEQLLSNLAAIRELVKGLPDDALRDVSRREYVSQQRRKVTTILPDPRYL